MAKFRTMHPDTPEVATHLMEDNVKFTTATGRLLRRFSLDEVPQLYNIIRGELTFVGPRPALPSQTDLLEKRHSLGIDRLVPGLTGWAQIHGRDSLSVDQKVAHDDYYMRHRSLTLDLQVALKTVQKVVTAEDVDGA